MLERDDTLVILARERFPDLHVTHVFVERGEGDFSAVGVIVRNGSMKEWREPLVVDPTSLYAVSRRSLGLTTIFACQNFEQYLNGELDEQQEPEMPSRI